MKSSDVVGYADTENGAAYCFKHGSADMTPIFADSEWDHFPTCDTCHERISDVSLTQDGIEYELGQQNLEVFKIVKADTEDDDAFHDEDGEYLGDGWYHWYCFPGCLPEGDPIGPYNTPEEAYQDEADSLW